MARGIDIPEVDWVLQYDPPSNARYSTVVVPLCLGPRLTKYGSRGSKQMTFARCYSNWQK